MSKKRDAWQWITVLAILPGVPLLAVVLAFIDWIWEYRHGAASLRDLWNGCLLVLILFTGGFILIGILTHRFLEDEKKPKKHAAQ